MHFLNRTAFTLVELLVVITILAVLGTIGYLSVIGYTENARNSVRINDIKSISKALELHLTAYEVLPNPDDSTNISYSGGIIWKQGTFSGSSLSAVRKLSEIPIDPTFKIPYSYSILPSGRYYQIAGITTQKSLLGESNIFASQAHAIKSFGFSSYVTGNYSFYNSVVKSGNNCYIIPTPSIFLSDIPSSETLSGSLGYSFLENGGSNIPSTYSGSNISKESSLSFFQVDEIWNSCSVENIEDLSLIIARLSHAFQQMSDNPAFDNLIYNSHTLSSKKSIVSHLETLGIRVKDSLKRELNSPLPTQTYSDNFSNTDTTNLINDHILPWTAISGGSGSYIISSNTLQKNISSPSIISPLPSPPISKAEYSVSFEAIDFAGGAIEVFLRYIDNDNYYKLRVDPNGYQISRNLAGIESIAQSITEGISDGSTVQFSIVGSELTLKINSIEKEKIIIPGINNIGTTALSLENQNARIDNYVFLYK